MSRSAFLSASLMLAYGEYAFGGTGDRYPPFPLTGRSIRAPRHNDSDEAARYRDDRRARKLRAALRRGEPIGDEALRWLERHEVAS